MNESHVKYALAHDWVGSAWIEEGMLFIDDIADNATYSFESLLEFKDHAGY